MGWLILSGLTNVILGMYIIQLVDQRHELDQQIGELMRADLKRLKEK